jgi:FMN-dependent NADH-azoreductase
MSVLLIQSSARGEASVTRALARQVAERFAGPVAERDVSAGLPPIDAAWVAANFTDPAERDDAQRQALALSDALIAELRAADVLVIGAPIYNFAPPAALKLWIDQIARARETFRYTETGPVGLLTGKRAVIVTASGGTAVGSEIDFATGYLRHILGFVGVTDVEIIAADRTMADDGSVERARSAIAALAA